MDVSTAKRVALLSSVAAGVVTAAGQTITEKSYPQLTVVVATFGLAALTTAVAEVAPAPAAAASLTILATALFALSDAPWKFVANLAVPRPPDK